MRDAQLEDISQLVELAVLTEMFTEDERDVVEEMMTEYFDSGILQGHFCVVDDRAGTLTGAAYVQPKLATDRAWDLTMMVVAPDRQRTGFGSRLLAHVEDQLRMQNQRLLFVETSATPTFETARAFYRKNLYEEVASIPDYWEDDDGLVMFAKRI